MKCILIYTLVIFFSFGCRTHDMPLNSNLGEIESDGVIELKSIFYCLNQEYIEASNLNLDDFKLDEDTKLFCGTSGVVLSNEILQRGFEGDINAIDFIYNIILNTPASSFSNYTNNRTRNIFRGNKLFELFLEKCKNTDCADLGQSYGSMNFLSLIFMIRSIDNQNPTEFIKNLPRTPCDDSTENGKKQKCGCSLSSKLDVIENAYHSNGLVLKDFNEQ